MFPLIRNDFPLLQQTIDGKPLVYLDNAASTLRPRVVVDAMIYYEYHTHSNVHRGVHTLSQRATEAYENSRERLRNWLGAKSSREIIFTKGTTESLNLIAWGWGGHNLKEGDEILLSAAEHHANIVPWQMVAKRTGAVLRYIPLDPESHTLDLTGLDDLLSPKTRIVSIAQVSNTLGSLHPIEIVIERAREVGALIVVDGAQSAPHFPVDVQALDCDFFVCSAHKMCGPTGVGLLYGKEEHLQATEPMLGGGAMIQHVDWDYSTWNELPYKLEAGTPPIAAAVGWAVAIDYLDSLGWDNLLDHDQALCAHLLEGLRSVEGLTIYAADAPRVGTFSFTIDGVHPFDLGQILDLEGVAIRTGHHCTQLLMRSLGIDSTARASCYFYNTLEEIDCFVESIEIAKSMLA